MRYIDTFFAYIKKYQKLLVATGVLVGVGLLVALAIFLQHTNVQVLNPAGIVSHNERKLMIFTVLLGVLVVVPVFAITIFIAIKYREKNSGKNTYSPEWDSNKLIETIWWGIPIALIGILATVTWITTFKTDPYKPLHDEKKTMTIQVVSLDWKWLFIYPDEGIATVNFVQFPVGQQVDFQLTSDTVMNSFWIPQLGGQMYTMPGMMTHLYLVADRGGDFKGVSANISGQGFEGMKFTARASSEEDYHQWVAAAKQSSQTLTHDTYTQLAKQSKNNPVTYYAAVDKNLYDTIVMKYMMPTNPNTPDAAETHDHTHSMDMSHVEGMQ